MRYRVASLVLATLILSPTVLILAPPAAAANRTFAVEMRNLEFNPVLINVDPGDNVSIVLFNNETGTSHTFDIDELNVHSGLIAAGQSLTINFTVGQAGTLWFYCAIPGHATRAGTGWTGMAGRLVVGQTPTQDLTLVYVGVGIIAATVLAAVAVWMRRPPKA